MSIAVPSTFVSTIDLVSVKNSLQSLLILQGSTGALPYEGVPLGSLIFLLIGSIDNYLNAGHVDYLRANWDKFKLGLNYSLSMIGSSRMANVTTAAD
jgi:splicing factor 3B subunit 1